MRIADLVPGILIKPSPGHSWVEVTWAGVQSGESSQYLCVVSDRKKFLDEDSTFRNEPVLYLGTTETTSAPSTPGKQVVLAWGKKMTIDPKSWRYITT